MAKPRSPRQIKAVAQSKPQEIPADLQDKVKALAALSTISKLLQNGHFPYRDRELLEQSFVFLEALHGPMFAEAAKHPSAHLIEGLKTQKQIEATNG